eukprot:282830-Chlamydomonas_euryale.AAC.2
MSSAASWLGDGRARLCAITIWGQLRHDWGKRGGATRHHGCRQLRLGWGGGRGQGLRAIMTC